jgi:hypothetical protein
MVRRTATVPASLAGDRSMRLEGQSRGAFVSVIVPPMRPGRTYSLMEFKGLVMANGFDEREKAFETKWAHDEELRFKVEARRDKLLGLWAAGEMGLSGAEADAYAKSLVEADMMLAGDTDVFEKLKADFAAKGIARTDHLIRGKMNEMLATAKSQVMNETD